MTARRWLTERARRSSLTTTRVSPGRISCSRRASTGRLRSAPEACSSSTVAQPAARGSSSRRCPTTHADKTAESRATKPSDWLCTGLDRGTGPRSAARGRWLRQPWAERGGRRRATLSPCAGVTRSANICLPRLNKACPNSSKWRESLSFRVVWPERPASCRSGCRPPPALSLARR